MQDKYVIAEAKLLRYPLAGPTGGSGLTAVDVLLVEIEDNNGIRGWGISYVLGAGGEIALHAGSDLLDRFVKDQIIISPQDLWQQMNASLNRIGRGIHYIAMTAIDVAAWDLHAKQLGIPLGEAMGGRMRAVPVYGSGGFRPNMAIDKALEQAQRYVEQGCQAIKLRLSTEPYDAELIAGVRKGLPETIDIMVDVNEKGNLIQAKNILDICKEYNVLWVEEPVKAYDIAAYTELAEYSDTAIATGEHLQGRSDFLHFLREKNIKYAQPDLAMMGGLTECMHTSRLCNDHDVAIAPHFLPSIFIHLAAVAPNLTWLEDFPLLEPLFTNPVTIKSGMIEPPTEPGHGLQLADNAIKDYKTD